MRTDPETTCLLASLMAGAILSGLLQIATIMANQPSDSTSATAEHPHSHEPDQATN